MLSKLSISLHSTISTSVTAYETIKKSWSGGGEGTFWREGGEVSSEGSEGGGKIEVSRQLIQDRSHKVEGRHGLYY